MVVRTVPQESKLSIGSCNPQRHRRAKQWTMIMQHVLGSLLDLLDVNTAIELKTLTEVDDFTY
jgi:hypothetical protein